MSNSQTTKLDPKMIMQVLQKTKTTCREAFGLISSDDARKEGFFRRAKPEVESFWVLEHMKGKSEKTREGVYVALEDERSGLPWLELYNESFSIKVEIFFSTIEQTDRYSPPPLSPSLLRIYGLSSLQERQIEMCDWDIKPIKTDFGDLLYARFLRYRSELMRVQGSPFNNHQVGENLVPELPIGKFEVIQEIFAKIIKYYWKDNYEMAKVALNLLAEFEAMLDSVIKHFEGVSNE